MNDEKRQVLVVAPHPDDEVLGCGGTIAKHAQRGDSVHLCVVTSAYEPKWSKTFIDGRPDEVRRAGALLGITGFSFLDFPTAKLDTVSRVDINDKLAEVMRSVKPDVLYIPHRGDLNHDHGIVHVAALVAARPHESQSVREIWAYETLSETEWGIEPFITQRYEDITATLAKKHEAMDVYASELKKPPHPRSHEVIDALAVKRGSEVGIRAAEAFTLIRSVS